MSNRTASRSELPSEALSENHDNYAQQWQQAGQLVNNGTPIILIGVYHPTLQENRVYENRPKWTTALNGISLLKGLY